MHAAYSTRSVPLYVKQAEALLLEKEALGEIGESERPEPLPFRDYIREAWRIVEPSTEYVPGWHIDAISDHLEAVTRGEIRNLLLNLPPRHMKSLLVSVFWPTWAWTFDPSVRWLFTSYTQSLSTRDSLKSRRIIQSSWYQRHWGSMFELTSDQNVKTRYENDKTGYRISTSVGGSATGEGASCLVCDDGHNVNEVESDTRRQTVLDWWDQVMSTRLDDPKTGCKVIVMQRIHENDLSGHVLEQGGYEHLCLPAEYEPREYVTSIGFVDPRTQPDEPLWPERFGTPELDELKRRMGSYAAAGQLQQRPSPAEGGVIKRHWWQWYDEVPPKFEEQLQSWDCAFKDKSSSDYVVGQVWGRRGAKKYLLDQTRARLTFTGTLDAIRKMSAKWPQAKAKLVEDKANGTAVLDTLKREIDGLIAVEPRGGKESRAHAVTPTIEAGDVYLPRAASWSAEFCEECAAFPNGAHDDQVDAMTQALSRMLKREKLIIMPSATTTPSRWRV